MKKLVILIFLSLLLVSLVAAQNQQNQQNQQSQNQDSISVVEVQNKVRTGDYTSESGKKIRIEAENENRVKIKSNNVSAECECEIEQEQVQNKTKLKVKLSNGRNAEIKVMPDTASETALARLRLRNCVEEEGCVIELKEVGKGNQTRAAYELKTQRQSKILGLFRARMQVQAQVDAESGEIIRTRKPWWAFLASEVDEIEEPEETSE